MWKRPTVFFRHSVQLSTGQNVHPLLSTKFLTWNGRFANLVFGTANLMKIFKLASLHSYNTLRCLNLEREPTWDFSLKSTHTHMSSTADRSGHKLHCKYLLTCCGLHSDRVAALSAGVNKSNNSHPEITPVRGEYLAVSKKVAQSLVDTNIYPVPDPHFPFLGDEWVTHSGMIC